MSQKAIWKQWCFLYTPQLKAHCRPHSIDACHHKFFKQKKNKNENEKTYPKNNIKNIQKNKHEYDQSFEANKWFLFHLQNAFDV